MTVTAGVDIMRPCIGSDGQWHLMVSAMDNGKITGKGHSMADGCSNGLWRGAGKATAAQIAINGGGGGRLMAGGFV